MNRRVPIRRPVRGVVKALAAAGPDTGPPPASQAGDPWFDIANCLYWCDARYVTYDAVSSKITSIYDRVGGAALTQATDTRRFVSAGNPRAARVATNGARILSRGGNNGTAFEASGFSIITRYKWNTNGEWYPAAAQDTEVAPTAYRALRVQFDGTLQLVSRGGGAAANSGGKAQTLTTGTWYTNACTYDGATITWYRDGASIGTTAYVKAVADSMTVWSMGLGAFSSFATIDGGVSAVWPGILSAGNMATIHTYCAAAYL